MRPLALGIGHPHRGDDAAGWLAAAALARRAIAGLDVETCDGSALALVDAWRDRGEVVVIDAAAGDVPAGTIVLVDPSSQRMAQLRCSSHALGLAEAVALSRALGSLPARLVIVAIVGADFSLAAPTTPAVAAAAERVASLWSDEGRFSCTSGL